MQQLTVFKRPVKFFLWMISFLTAIVLTQPASAQKNLPDVTLTIDVTDMPLSRLLEIIAEKSGLPFSYNPKKIPAGKSVRYSADNKSLTFILDELSQQIGLR